MVVDEIGAYLAANGIGTLAVDLFKHVAPDKPDELTIVTEYAGDDPGWVQDAGLIEVENSRVQIACRAIRPEVCRETAERAYQLLMAIHNNVLSGTRILWCMPVDTPSMIGRDENGRFMTTVNFRVAKELSSV